MRWWRGAIVLLVLLLAGCGSGAVGDAADSGRSTSARSVSPSSAPPSSGSPSSGSPSSTPPSAPPTVAAPPPVVVLDPGHNGGNAAHPEVVNAPVPDGTGGTKPCNTTGTESVTGYPEHAFTWDVTLRTRDRLAASGVEVVLTREDDAGVGPCVDVRGRLAGEVGAAAFVSIHGDGAGAGGRGFHVITSSLAPAGPEVATASTGLATALRDALVAVQPASTYTGHDGLVARPDLAGLNLNAVPAVYVECGNMRNATDAAFLGSEAGRASLADRLAAGILAFLGR